MKWTRPGFTSAKSAVVLLIGSCIGMTVVLFVMTWLGMNNRGRPYFWGEPLPFHEALAQVPHLFVAATVMTSVVYLFLGFRSDGGSNT